MICGFLFFFSRKYWKQFFQEFVYNYIIDGINNRILKLTTDLVWYHTIFHYMENKIIECVIRRKFEIWNTFNKVFDESVNNGSK